MQTFYVRMLLHVVEGPRSFEGLKMVDGVQHDSYKSACFALGLIEDDSEWDVALREASSSAMPAQIRQLFVIILTCGCPLDALQLWEDHKDAMSEDFAHERSRGASVQESDYNMALLDIENRLQDHVVSELSGYGLPTPTPPASNDMDADGDDDDDNATVVPKEVSKHRTIS
jgi:hypothetical protein